MKIDHLEVFVPDRREAAAWYGTVLGFEILRQHEHWAVEGGPLMISNDGGDTMLALFEGEPQGSQEVHGWRRLALRADAEGLMAFLRSSSAWRDAPLGSADVRDHGKAFSVYFRDPYGNLLEVTTYDYAAASRLLGR